MIRTTTTNNKRNAVGTNNSANNTSSKFKPSSIEGEINVSEKCDNEYAVKENEKENIPVLN